MWTITDENQVTLRQCLKCALKPECKILDNALEYNPRRASVVHPKFWKEGTGLKSASCSKFTKI